MRQRQTWTIDEKVLIEIRKVRGDVPASRWVEQSIKQRLERDKKAIGP